MNQYLSRPNISAGLLALALFLYLLDALPLANFVGLLALNFALYGRHCLSGKSSGQHSAKLKLGKLGLWLACILLGFFIALYRPEDFNYPLVHTFDSLHFELYANLGKALAGAAVLLWLWPNATPSKALPFSLLLSFTAALCLIIVAANIFGISWLPKLPKGIAWFLLINLIVTVVAEEAFFRLLLQEQLNKFLATKLRSAKVAAALALIGSATLFALAHMPPLHPLFGLYLLAGLLYAGIYSYTGRVSAAITTHFAVNALHFILLQYPAM